MNRIVWALAGMYVGLFSTGAWADVLYNQTFTGAQLHALVPGTASFPGTDENSLSGSQLQLSGSSGAAVLYRLPIISTGGLTNFTDLVVTITIDYQQLTGDNDFGIAISDGVRILGGMQGDQPVNWSLDSPDTGTQYGPEDFAPSAGLSFVSPLTYVITAEPIAGASTVTATNANSSSVTHVSLGAGFNYSNQVDFLLVGDGAAERYGVNNVTILATANPVTPVPEPTSLAMWSLLVLGGAGYGWRNSRRRQATRLFS